MANLKDCSKWNIHNDFYTRKKTWEQVQQFIPKDKVLWEFCLLNSNEQSKTNLIELGYEVVGDKTIDFLTTDFNGGDILITNPPFQTDIKIPILKKLAKLDKPFIIIMNSLNLFTKYFKEIFKDKEIYFIYPSTKINYDKYIDGHFVKTKDNTSFYSIYVCYKIGLDKNVWI